MIQNIDHLVLTVRDIDATCKFYTRILGMKMSEFGNNRKALHFGRQKINLHQAGKEFEPKAMSPTPGSADICFIASKPLDEILRHVTECGVNIIEGPVKRTGATGEIESIYIRDPDGNLLEIAHYQNK
jgi:catechol 2,3-dioxygenase-like lactoylglutathione lyase family enzyme